MMERYMFMMKTQLYVVSMKKTGHMKFRCRDRPKTGSPNHFMTNTKGPKKIWVPKKIFFFCYRYP